MTDPTSCLTKLSSAKGYGALLAIVFLLDLAVTIAVFLIGRHDSQEAHRAVANAFADGSSDTLNCYLARIIGFPLMAFVAYKVYHRTAAHSPVNRMKALEQAQRQQAPSSPDLEGGARELRSNLGTPLQSDSGSIVSDDSNATSSLSSTATDEKEEAQQAFERKQEHTLVMKRADRYRTVALGFLFLVSTGMSMYNGLKCVDFDYDLKIIAIQATLLASIIFFINTEFFLIREFLSKLTEEKGELIPGMHMHPLFFETDLKCHICDICHESMKKPHYVAYRCRTCDFDLCPRCYRQKDKASAKGFGARSLRGDGEQLTTWTFFLRIVKISMQFRFTMCAALSCLIITQLLTVWAPHIQGSIFDSLIAYLRAPEDQPEKQHAARGLFEHVMLSYLALNVSMGLFGGLKNLFQELVVRQLACAVRSQLFNSVIRMDIAFFDGMHTGQLTSRLTNDASQMVQPLQTLMNDLLANLIQLAGGMLMAFTTSWKLSILALTVVPPITFVYRRYAQWGRRVNRDIYCAYGEANSTATEAIHNIRTVRGFSTEQHETEKYDFSINTALSHGKKNAYVSGSVNAFSSYMTSGTAVLILWYGGTLVCDSKGSQMTIGELITFQLYWNMMNSGFIALSNVFNDLIRSASAAERVCSLIDARPEVDPDAGEEVSRESVDGNLQLQGVQFRYRTRPDNLVLKGIDLTMTPGTTTALVGKSGGGKSTLVHLLMRFYEPTAGKLLLDGKDMALLSSRSVRKLCGFVAQDTQLFACSVEDNLKYGLGREASREEVEAACRKANAHDFIMQTEDQYDTRVGEKGIMLSGGQRQRLAIARCFLREPRLLFLDEATSALDAENEAIVQQAIESLIEESRCTVVLIAHRLSTVINSKQIAVVHEGQIFELGNHEELLEKGGIYAQLVKRQMARDASSVMEDKKDAKETKKKEPKGGKASVQTEIDELIEEMEKTGSLHQIHRQLSGDADKAA
jgi:ABC-type multidrug transport system fused ATPase/permease subunit